MCNCAKSWSQAEWPDVGIKSSQICQKWPKSSHNSFWLKLTFFKVAPKSWKCLGNFCKQICPQDLPKIAKSGHTDPTCITYHQCVVQAEIRGRMICKVEAHRGGYFCHEVTDAGTSVISIADCTSDMACRESDPNFPFCNLDTGACQPNPFRKSGFVFRQKLFHPWVVKFLKKY